MDQAATIRKRRAELRERVIRNAEKHNQNARVLESPRSLQQAVELGSRLKGADSKAAAREVLSINTADGKLRHLLENVLDKKNGYTPEQCEYLLSQVDMEYFAMRFLPHHFTQTIVDPKTGESTIFHPNFHQDLVRIFRKITMREIHAPIVVAGFPQSGKTTMCSLLYPLHNICHGGFKIVAGGKPIDVTKRFHLFVSAVQSNAINLMSAVLDELETNERITDFYGSLYRSHEGGVRQKWSAGKADTANGVHLEARSKSAKFRTIKWRQYRPDLGIADDVETDEGVMSKRIRDKTDTFFFNVFIPRFAEDRGDIIVLGNLIDENSLMSKLVKHGDKLGWTVRVYRLYEKTESGEKKYLMPEHYGEAYEKRKLDQMLGNTVKFDQEYLQDTKAGMSELRFEDVEFITRDEFDEALDRCAIYAATDPAASADPTSDYFAIAGVAHDEEERVSYVMPMVHDRLNVGDQIKRVAAYYVLHQPWRMGVESVAYQKVLVHLVEDYCDEHDIQIDLVPVKQERIHKHARIRRLFPMIKSGRLKFLIDDPAHIECVNQLLAIGRGVEPPNDDLADALEMATRLRDEDLAGTLEVKDEGFAQAMIAVGKHAEQERVSDPQPRRAVSIDAPDDEDAAEHPRGRRRG